MATLETVVPDRINIRIRMEDGALWATVEEFPGVFATGETPEDLRASIEEGIALYVAEPAEGVRPVHLPPLEPANTTASTELAFA